MLTGFYSYPLVALSVLIAICASYMALDLGARTSAARGAIRLAWLGGGAVAMGFGIWSMHYVGMLAFALPILVRYDLPMVILSLVAAIVASGVALFVTSRETVTVGSAGFGSVLMGTAIVAMHYIGMAAMRLPAMCHYDVALVALSYLIAIAGSLAALWLTFRFRKPAKGVLMWKILSAVAMGFAIAAMHYTGMAASSFSVSNAPVDYSHAVTVSSLGTAGIVIVTFFVLGFAGLTSIADQRIATHRGIAEELYRSRQMLKSILDNIPQRVFWKDRNEHYLGCNRAFARDAGLGSPEDIPGKTDLDLSWREPVPPYARDLRTAVEKGSAVLNSEYETIGAAGNKCWLRFSAIPLLNPDGEIFGVLGSYEDITEHKRAEDAIKRSNAALSDFAHVVSHDLQAPLRTARTYTQLVSRKHAGQLEEAGRALLQSAEDSLLHMYEMIRSLLSYATATEPELGGQQEVSMESSLDRVRANLQSAIQETDTKISYGPLPMVTAHPAQLVQILQNLVSNAIKYQRHGTSPHIRVGAKDMGNEWMISVQDNGTGIAREDLTRIFAPRKRLHGTEIPGFGIGLATCRSIVDHHGGQIWAESEVGLGSTFYFTLPKRPQIDSSQRAGRQASAHIPTDYRDDNGRGPETSNVSSLFENPGNH